MQRLLNSPEPGERDLLRKRIEELETEVAELKAQLAQANSRDTKAGIALSRLRRELEPLHVALRMVFGELDSANIPTDATRGGGTDDGGGRAPLDPAKWEPWKRKYPGKCADMIDCLLTYEGGLSRTQLAAFTKQDRGSGNYRANISKLNSAGLIEESGGKLRLLPL